jgi:SAM-dependent methyltransferase
MTDWQQHYDTGATPWDRGGPAPALVQWIEERRRSPEAPGSAAARPQIHGRVLVPGCGHGHDLVPLADSGAAEVIGLDLAPGAVSAAGQRTAALANVSVIEGDFFEFAHGAGRGQFDWMFEHTCFCAIDLERRDDYVRAASAALKPGGHLLAVFYLNPWDPGEDQSQGPPFGSTIEELDRRFSPHFRLLESYVPTVSYSGREGKELVRLLKRK